MELFDPSGHLTDRALLALVRNEELDELARLETELEANSSDYAKVTALMQAQQETQQKLEEAMDRWMYLQEKWERISQQKGDKV